MSKTVYPACLHQTPDDPSGLIVTGWGLTGEQLNSFIHLLSSTMIVNQSNYERECREGHLDHSINADVSEPNNQNSRSKLLQAAKLQPVPVNTCKTLLRRHPSTQRVVIESQMCAISAPIHNSSTRPDACQVGARIIQQSHGLFNTLF